MASNIINSPKKDVFFDHLRKGILKEFDFRSDLEDKLLAKNYD